MVRDKCDDERIGFNWISRMSFWQFLGLLLLLFKSSLALGNAEERSLVVAGVERHYLVYVPDSVKPNAPLVLVFHGYTGTARQTMAYSGMNEQADKHQFIVAYPQGTEDSKGYPFFNVEYSMHLDNEVDDILYTRLLVAELSRVYELNPDAIFATGMSNGGDMSYLLACKASDLFSGIAPVAGTMMNSWAENCDPGGMMPVLAIHGTHDDITRFNGDPEDKDGWGKYLAQEDIMDYWIFHNGLEKYRSLSLPDVDPDDDSRVRLKEYWSEDHDIKVLFYIVENGGHDWPGMRYTWWNPLYYFSRYQMGFGQTRDIDSSELIWKFFSAVLSERGRQR